MLNLTTSYSVIDKYYQNQSVINKYRKAYNLTDKDKVQIMVVPKGMAGKRKGSFICQTMTEKAIRLKLERSKLKRKIAELEIENMPKDEKSQKLKMLNTSLQYVTNAFNAEIACLPKSGFIVVEEEDSEN